MKKSFLILLALLAALSGCFVHTYTATYPNSGCETSTVGNAALQASNTNCGNGSPAPTPAAQP